MEILANFLKRGLEESGEEEESIELAGRGLKSVETLGTETSGKGKAVSEEGWSEVLESTEMSMCEEGKDSGTRGDVKSSPVAIEGKMWGKEREEWEE